MHVDYEYIELLYTKCAYSAMAFVRNTFCDLLKSISALHILVQEIELPYYMCFD